MGLADPISLIGSLLLIRGLAESLVPSTHIWFGCGGQDSWVAT